MAKAVHLIGMGVLGSVCAWMLLQQKISFTWEDNDSPYVAWKASTGLIYPSGDELEFKQYKQWASWIEPETFWSVPAPWQGVQSVETALCKGSFWFSSKLPPHGGDYPILTKEGPLQLGALPSYHMNPQQFVQETRKYFQEQRRNEIPTGAVRVISHGFQRKAYYVWGWSARVIVKFHPDVLQHSTDRPSLYVRKGRFQLAYANPIPNEPFHYAGSSMMVQKEPHTFEVEKKYRRWEALIRELSGEMVVGIDREGGVLQGWRPTEKQGDMRVEQKNDVFYFPPMSGSGVRMAPYVCEQLVNAL